LVAATAFVAGWALIPITAGAPLGMKAAVDRGFAVPAMVGVPFGTTLRTFKHLVGLHYAFVAFAFGQARLTVLLFTG